MIGYCKTSAARTGQLAVENSLGQPCTRHSPQATNTSLNFLWLTNQEKYFGFTLFLQYVLGNAIKIKLKHCILQARRVLTLFKSLNTNCWALMTKASSPKEHWMLELMSRWTWHWTKLSMWWVELFCDFCKTHNSQPTNTKPVFLLRLVCPLLIWNGVKIESRTGAHTKKDSEIEISEAWMLSHCVSYWKVLCFLFRRTSDRRLWLLSFGFDR